MSMLSREELARLCSAESLFPSPIPMQSVSRLQGFVNQRKAVGKAGWNPGLVEKEQTIDDLMFTNYIKEIYLDSDTKVACISCAPSEVPDDWFLTNEMKAQARAAVNGLAGTKRMFSHAIFTPGCPGWMEQIDYALAELKLIPGPIPSQATAATTVSIPAR
ncbi:MAG: amidohydrolase 2 [Burkholderia sp.]|nr:amidohydrolase 2 [Burkholderia sp.]